MITHISAFAQVIGTLAQEHDLGIREVLNKISKPWESDMRVFFYEECHRAQIVAPDEETQLPEVLSELYTLADETGE